MSGAKCSPPFSSTHDVKYTRCTGIFSFSLTCFSAPECIAATAEGTPRLREQRVSRRVMQIHVVLVREHELDVSERVAGTRPLPEHQASCGVGITPVHVRGLERLRRSARHAQDLNALPVEVVRIARDRRGGFTFRNRVGNIPIW